MQAISDFWKTTIGKLTIIGGGSLAGLISLCFVCTICGALFGSDDIVQDVAPAEIVAPEATATPIETISTATPTSLSPTEPPAPIATETSPTETPTTEIVDPVILAGDSNINLRSGPGTEYEEVGILASGESLKVVGRNADSSWWQVSTPEGLAWVAASVVTANNVVDESIPVVEAPPAPIPTEPPSGEPVATEQPPVEACDCSGNHYNCPDFGTHASAQACYEYCISTGRGDVHGLDRDEDGTACDPTNW